MLIILEGADKTGKTTLAQHLTKELGWEYEHLGPPPTEGDYPRFLIERLMALHQPTVYDRFHVSELVYGPVLRGRTILNRLEVLTLERLARLRNAVLIHADAPWEWVKTAFNEAQEYVTTEQNRVVHAAFKGEILKRNLLYNLRYDASKPKALHEVVSFITMNRRELAAAGEAQRVCHGVGTAHVGALVLVGETLNPNTTRFGLPFDGGPTAAFLHTCLEEAGVDERFVYVTNADQLDEAEVRWHQVRGSVMVALGTAAGQALKRFHASPYRQLPHPRYWREHHSQDWRTYTGWLEEAFRELIGRYVEKRVQAGGYVRELMLRENLKMRPQGETAKVNLQAPSRKEPA